MKQTIRRVEGGPRGQVQGALTNTKQAVAIATCGLPLVAVHVEFNEEHPREIDGVKQPGIAHFVFTNDTENILDHYARLYDAGEADVEMDRMLDRFAKDTNPAVRAAIAELEPAIVRALVVYGRRFLENYQRFVSFLKDEADEIIVMGGERTTDPETGRAALQNFRFKYVRREAQEGNS